MPELKDGSFVEDRRLDRLVHYDERSKAYPIMELVEGRQPRSYTWRCNYVLDQGREGRCVEFGWCAEMLARPVAVAYHHVETILSQRDIYHPAQHDDPWSGCYLGPDCPIESSPEQYEGTSVLAGVRRAVQLGYYGEFRWAFSLMDLVLGVGWTGPAVLGIPWYSSDYEPEIVDGYPTLTGKGTFVGYHAIMMNAVSVKRRDAGVHNSWGHEWGDNGKARISWDELERRLHAQGEACIPVTRVRRASLVN